jgi:uncharacterized protein YjiS (DUF1127 family)
MAIDLHLRSPGRPVASHRRAGLRRVVRLLEKVWKTILRWHEVRRQRRALLALSDQLLKDIGISRADATREAARPFWDAEVESWRGLR